METKRSAYEDGLDVETGRTSSSNREEYISMTKTNAAQILTTKAQEYVMQNSQGLKDDVSPSAGSTNTLVNIETEQSKGGNSGKHQITVP